MAGRGNNSGGVGAPAWAYMLQLGLFAILGATLVYPIVLMVRGAFAADAATGDGWTLDRFVLIFDNPALTQGMLNSVYIAVCTTILSIILALPLALIGARYRFPGKSIFSALVLAPMILPPFVGAIGMTALVGREGALNSLLGLDVDWVGLNRFWGVVIVEALHLYPIIYLNAVAALANLDPALHEAAQSQGASGWRRLTRITLPLIRPGLFAGGTIVFIWSLTELGTPLMFDYTMATPVQIFNGLKSVENSTEPYALTLILLVSAATAYVAGKLTLGGRGYAMSSKASRAAAEKKLGPIGSLAALGAFTFVTALALAPHAGVVLKSFSETWAWYGTVLPTAYTTDHYVEALGRPDAFNAITTSLKLSVAAVILNVIFGLAAAYVITRTRVLGRSVLDTLCMIPLAAPGLVMAFGYVAVTLRWPFADGDPLDGTIFDLEVFGVSPNPLPLLAIAYAVRRLPYVVRAAVAGLEQTEGEMEEAAMNLGASRLHAVRKVVVPLIMANLIAGALLAFSFSMLEVSDSLLLAQKQEHFPITRAIFMFFVRLADGPFVASAMGVWGMALLGVTLVGASVLMGKRLGAVFRA